MDKTTKLLLAAIALGLWANAIPKVEAQGGLFGDMPLEKIQHAIESLSADIGSITYGTCPNQKLCK
jgi:hypothetical protein